MRHNLSNHITLLLLLTLLISCGDNSKKCEPIQEWNVKDYRIIKSRCPDMVLAFYYDYDIYTGEERKGSVSQVDSCIFTWQADNESFLTLNTCDNSIQELKPHKIPLDEKAIDSITIFSRELNQTQPLTSIQKEKLIKDWNNSKIRGYSDKPFDSAFYRYYPYQYKLTIFSNNIQRQFYGYNYLILDSSNWEYEMSKTGELEYFHKYWNK